MSNIINELVKIIEVDEKKRSSFINAVRIRLQGNKKLNAEFNAALLDFSSIIETDNKLINAAQTKEQMLKALLNKSSVQNEINIVNLSENNIKRFIENITILSGLARSEMIAAKKQLSIDNKWIKINYQEIKELQKEQNIFMGNNIKISAQEFDAVKKRAINILTQSMEIKRKELATIRDNIIKINKRLPKNTESLNPQQTDIATKLKKAQVELMRSFNAKRIIVQREINLINNIASGTNFSDSSKKILNTIATDISKEKADLVSEEKILQEMKRLSNSIYQVNLKQIENLNKIKELLSKTGGSIGTETKFKIKTHLNTVLSFVETEIIEIRKSLNDAKHLDVVDRQILLLSKEAADEMTDLIHLILGNKDAAMVSELSKITDKIEGEDYLVDMLKEMGIRK